MKFRQRDRPTWLLQGTGEAAEQGVVEARACEVESRAAAIEGTQHDAPALNGRHREHAPRAMYPRPRRPGRSVLSCAAGAYLT